jgi:hypothetical protein
MVQGEAKTMNNAQNALPTTLSQTKLFTISRLHTCNYQVPAQWPKIAESLNPILENPNIPPFLKWGIQSLCIAYVLPHNRRGLFRALFLLAWRSFAATAKDDQIDPAFEYFYRQALHLDRSSVQTCLKKLRYPGKI